MFKRVMLVFFIFLCFIFIIGCTENYTDDDIERQDVSEESQCIDNAQESYDNLFREGIRYFDDKNFTNAMFCFENASIIDSQFLNSVNAKNSYLYCFLASCYQITGNISKAEVTYRTAIFFNPGLTKFCNEKLSKLLSLKKQQESKEYPKKLEEERKRQIQEEEKKIAEEREWKQRIQEEKEKEWRIEQERLAKEEQRRKINQETENLLAKQKQQEEIELEPEDSEHEREEQWRLITQELLTELLTEKKEKEFLDEQEKEKKLQEEQERWVEQELERESLAEQERERLAEQEREKKRLAEQEREKKRLAEQEQQKKIEELQSLVKNEEKGLWAKFSDWITSSEGQDAIWGVLRATTEIYIQYQQQKQFLETHTYVKPYLRESPKGKLQYVDGYWRQK